MLSSSSRGSLPFALLQVNMDYPVRHGNSPRSMTEVQYLRDFFVAYTDSSFSSMASRNVYFDLFDVISFFSVSAGLTVMTL